jgi:hypothetical protein
VAPDHALSLIFSSWRYFAHFCIPSLRYGFMVSRCSWLGCSTSHMFPPEPQRLKPNVPSAVASFTSFKE